MYNSSAVTLIKVNSLKPLHVSFPAPGVYEGTIKIILPDNDPTILARMGRQGAELTAIVIKTEGQITAGQLLLAMRQQIETLEATQAAIAQPVRQRKLSQLTPNAKPRRNFRVRKLVALDNPLEST